ncbi:MAG: hypothetical protein QHG99_06225 [Methanomicrobiales archaeon]|nr:hypothetical protein [Methanomicrobiales archaeon]
MRDGNTSSEGYDGRTAPRRSVLSVPGLRDPQGGRNGVPFSREQAESGIPSGSVCE